MLTTRCSGLEGWPRRSRYSESPALWTTFRLWTFKDTNMGLHVPLHQACMKLQLALCFFHLPPPLSLPVVTLLACSLDVSPCMPAIVLYYYTFRASLVAQTVKKLPAMRKTQVWSLGWEDTLEKEMVTHPNILAWGIPWTEEVGRGPWEGKRAGHNLVTKPQLYFSGCYTVRWKMFNIENVYSLC